MTNVNNWTLSTNRISLPETGERKLRGTLGSKHCLVQRILTKKVSGAKIRVATDNPFPGRLQTSPLAISEVEVNFSLSLK